MEQPTYDALVIDDELTSVQRVVQYSRSSIPLQRLVHVRMISDTARSYGFEETCAQLFPVLAAVAQDAELVVRQALLEQVRELAELSVRPPHAAQGYEHVLHTFLPLVRQLLQDEEAKVRDVAGDTLVDVARVVRPADQMQCVLTIVVQMGHGDESEQNRMLALKLFNRLAPVLGADLCKQFVIPGVVCLAEDVDLRVRKAAAMNLANICAVSGEEETRERLLPAYVRLSTDEQQWVRKACADSLVDLSSAIPSRELRTGVLLTVFEQLARDEYLSVRKAALERAGPLIASLRKEDVPEHTVRGILNHFMSMAVDEQGEPNADSDLRRKCAHSLPAVVLTLGRTRWRELRRAFQVLVRDPEVAVRRTLAFSLHELATVLGSTAPVDADLAGPRLEPSRAGPGTGTLPPAPAAQGSPRPVSPRFGSRSPRENAGGSGVGAAKAVAPGSPSSGPPSAGSPSRGSPSRGSPSSKGPGYPSPGARSGAGARTGARAVGGVGPAGSASPRRNRTPGNGPGCAGQSARVSFESEAETTLPSGGFALVEAELLDAFELFLLDVEEVKIGVVNRLSDFLGFVSPERRTSYLRVLNDTLDRADRFNWRLREALARQLSPLCSLFDVRTVHEVLEPVVLTLLRDSVAQVRMEARRACSAVLHVIREDPESLAATLREIKAFAQASAFHHRQIFVYSFGDVAARCDAAFLRKHGLVDTFAGLADDRIVSVRVAMSRLLGDLCADLRALPEMRRVEARLLEDPVEDVRHFARVSQGQADDGVPEAHPRPESDDVR